MTQEQHATLQAHLFPGDGKEAVALLLCGRRCGREQHVFTTREVVEVPHDVCDRSEDRITWPTSYVDRVLEEAYGRGQAVVKVHSHPTGYRRFSVVDDLSDRALFAPVASLLDDNRPHASVVMLPDGEMFGRVLGGDGESIQTLSTIMVVGDDLRICMRAEHLGPISGFTLRHAQAFGNGTTQLLRQLSVAVIGCSGTGSIVTEQLARLGVGRLVLVDPDAVEEKNLNRIVNSGQEDAYLRRPKVEVLASAIARMGLGQEVVPISKNLANSEVVKDVAECDVVFGCMDGVEGRHLLNRLATFYTIPYFDVGVRLDADGAGGIASIAGTAHYLQPGRSSLLSRGLYDMAHVEAEEMRRVDPAMYERQVGEGYLRGVLEDRPAVISVNMLCAALVVNDFLARLHPYRNQPNSAFAQIAINLAEVHLLPEPESSSCEVLARHVGRGDVVPLLERPSLS